jgi:FkbM family methyltransferase
MIEQATAHSDVVGTGHFKFMSNDQYIGSTLRTGLWWENAMHAPMRAIVEKHCKPGDIILDIGANVGTHSVAFSKMAPEQQIHAFEPQADVCALLHANLDANNATNVQAHCFALGSTNQQARMDAYKVDADEVNVGGIGIHSESTGELVDVRTLKSALNTDARVCAIKIDVEGYENEVFRGAAETIERDQPIILFEDWTGQTNDYLHKIGFCTAPIDLSSSDYLAVPCRDIMLPPSSREQS